ncbi:hypothetical protein EVAR_50271_1 [Eumeta japonica]|uniref:Uncharacterized protein n=1 Tax=Eumeta variegata TaxID=151549 RepID=A0A4C1Y7R1_EUMVA|nr:hypothetical protein EVAR_50271_1 [Eumeta japonica]
MLPIGSAIETVTGISITADTRTRIRLRREQDRDRDHGGHSVISRYKRRRNLLRPSRRSSGRKLTLKYIELIRHYLLLNMSKRRGRSLGQKLVQHTCRSKELADCIRYLREPVQRRCLSDISPIAAKIMRPLTFTQHRSGGTPQIRVTTLPDLLAHTRPTTSGVPIGGQSRWGRPSGGADAAQYTHIGPRELALPSSSRSAFGKKKERHVRGNGPRRAAGADDRFALRAGVRRRLLAGNALGS